MGSNKVRSSCFFFAFVLICQSCAAPAPKPPAAKPVPVLTQITVEDLRVTCDLMARDLIMQEFIYTKKDTPIIAVKPIENKTDLTIDPDIFQKTIRVKLMEKSKGRILFRDEESYKYTLDERAKQSGSVQISSTTSRTRRRSATAVGRPIIIEQSGQTDTVMTDEAEVQKKVADVDYFLTGLIYSTTEELKEDNHKIGMRYFQFQFRITDAQSNIIMWEKEYQVKRQTKVD